MTASTTPIAETIRTCAGHIVAALRDHGQDSSALGEAIDAALRPLVAREDLLDAGAPRQGNNVAMSRYLYFDGELSILLYEVPKGQTIPAHDHGIWETITVYRGSMRHVVYERIDDRTRTGYAELRAIDDRVLQAHDFAIVAPPNDIHGFTAMSDGTYGITVVNGPYKDERHYYNPEDNSYVVKRQRNAR
jgi:predicted metal-dependent enzyme (double-stranded beta helix superfamily)